MKDRGTAAPDAMAIEDWILGRVATALEEDPARLDPELSFGDFGLGSVEAATLLEELEDWLGRPLEITLFWEYPTLRALARHLGGEVAALGVRDTASRNESALVAAFLRELVRAEIT